MRCFWTTTAGGHPLRLRPPDLDDYADELGADFEPVIWQSDHWPTVSHLGCQEACACASLLGLASVAAA